MRYELYYWPGIQGRGEFIRLALEDADADYVDVARRPKGMQAMAFQMKRNHVFAPPFLRAGELVVAQTAMILHYLGPRLGLAPKGEAQRLWLSGADSLGLLDPGRMFDLEASLLRAERRFDEALAHRH